MPHPAAGGEGAVTAAVDPVEREIVGIDHRHRAVIGVELNHPLHLKQHIIPRAQAMPGTGHLGGIGLGDGADAGGGVGTLPVAGGEGAVTAAVDAVEGEIIGVDHRYRGEALIEFIHAVDLQHHRVAAGQAVVGTGHLGRIGLGDGADAVAFARVSFDMAPGAVPDQTAILDVGNRAAVAGDIVGHPGEAVTLVTFDDPRAVRFGAAGLPLRIGGIVAVTADIGGTDTGPWGAGPSGFGHPGGTGPGDTLVENHIDGAVGMFVPLVAEGAGMPGKAVREVQMTQVLTDRVAVAVALQVDPRCRLEDLDIAGIAGISAAILEGAVVRGGVGAALVAMTHGTGDRGDIPPFR